MNIKQFAIGISAVAYFIGAAPIVRAQVADLPSVSDVQDAKVKTAMDLLETTANKLGPAKIEGSDVVGGKQVPCDLFWIDQDK